MNKILVWIDGIAVVRDQMADEIADPAFVLTSARAAMELTRRQVFIGLAAEGLISTSEAIAAAATGIPPKMLEAAFAAMPAPQQTGARITFAAFQTAYRLDPMVALLAQLAGLDDTAMDAFFTRSAAI